MVIRPAVAPEGAKTLLPLTAWIRAAALLFSFGITGAGAIPASASEASDWIVSHCTAPGGAIRVRPGGRYISGYFGTLVADALVQANEAPDVTLAWMEWYVSHAHDSGSGIDGVPDDVDLVDGSERSRGRPDSTDAYGATFLSLARHAFDSGNEALRDFVLAHGDALQRIMNSSLATMQANGLTFARPQYEMYYAIDNMQVYRGLVDASDLFARAFHQAHTAAYYERESRVARYGIDTILYDQKTQSFRPYMNALGTSGPANLDVAYPDALAQAFAVYYGVLDPARSAALLERAAPALMTAGPLDEHRLILDAARQRIGEPVDVPAFLPPKLCVDAAWYLLIARSSAPRASSF
jgi:hypothetical protein